MAKMEIISQLACSLGRRDEQPNIDLAKKIAAKKNVQAVQELADLFSGKNKDQQGDAIKVLYEIGVEEPELLLPHVKLFIALLNNKNNRLQWGAMTALSAIAPAAPKTIYSLLPAIMDAAEKGSVITRDHTINILVHLAGEKAYRKDALPLVLEMLQTAPYNQLPTYAEKILPHVGAAEKKDFLKVLTARLKDMEEGTKRKRLEKVVGKLRE
jgi:hypothetical protein